MATATLEQQLDALLIWLGNPDNPNVAVLDEAIARAGLTRLDAAGLAYDILDRLLFAGPNGSPEHILGLRDTTDVAAAKQRYRCLIQAYHPDRHPARVLVHNERTEQINIAYAAFERGVRESASRGAVASDPASTRKAARARRRRAPKRVDPYPLCAARSRQSLGARLRRWLGGAESFQARFFVGLILFCALLLASLLYPEPAPHRVSARLDVPAMPVSEARLVGVERPEASSDAAELRLDVPPTVIAPIRRPNSATPLLVASLADIRAEPIESPAPDAQMLLPAPAVSPSLEPVAKPAADTVAEPVTDPVRAPEPSPPPERKAAVLLPPEQTVPRLRAVPPPSLLGQSRYEAASLPDAPVIPLRVAPIRPVQALDSAHAPARAPDPSSHQSLVEVDATMRAPSATVVIPPVAMAGRVEDPTGPAANEIPRRAAPPASPAAQAPVRTNASADVPVQPPRKRPPAVEATSSKAASKTAPPADTFKGAPSPPGRSFSPAPESSEAVGCDPIAGALDRFRLAYSQGALGLLMALYSADAQENETRGWSGIRRLYLRWFDQTSDRRITFSGIRIVPEGKKRCGARAGFSVSYRDAQGRRVDRTGTMAMLFDVRGADARILRISY
ncbi:MAG: hypothetical protein EOM91_15080 [Sphingobacteriia bacterium]|nr:hypothetical protein [Sphingobacteriia bacterium]